MQPQLQGHMQHVSPHSNNFQFPPQMPQHQHLPVPNAPSQPSAHRRNHSAIPNMGMGPPPAPSSGASGFGDFGAQQASQGRENINPRGRGGGPAGAGHARRHSLALTEAKAAADLAEQKRKTSGFQFPVPTAGGAVDKRDSSPSGGRRTPTDQTQSRGGGRGGHGRSQSMATGRGGSNIARGGGNFQFPAPQPSSDANNNQAGQSDFQRRGSQGHGRTGSRNFEGNWRQPNTQQQQPQDNQALNMGNFNMNQTANAPPFQPGHRARGSINQSIGTLGNFQYAGGAPLMQLPQGQTLVPQQMFGQGLNMQQLAHLQALQAAQMNGQGMGGLQGSHHAQPQMNMQQQQQRKTLFTPYLPQANLPALLNDGQLVAGILRVNKKNRSDAYVTTNDLDADIFICGSKDRNRALEGDYVAVELLDVDEVWGQKREKEEKKKRKDNAGGSSIAVNDATTQPESNQAGDSGIRRRGSLRQRPTQKKNDDVEVEGQSLLLMEEEEINDELKPLYAGHIVAVIERTAGQMFSG